VPSRLKTVGRLESVGLALDDKRNLYLYIKGENVGIVARDVEQPCYFMVDLHGFWKQVRTLVS
jgi:hypothetical protein